MTIAQLKEVIKDLPDNMDVFVGERLTEYTYGLVNTAEVREIDFVEEHESGDSTKEEVLILEED